MKMISNVCLMGALGVVIAGIVSKYIASLGALQPASFLLMAQILILLSINFAIYELLNKK